MFARAFFRKRKKGTNVQTQPTPTPFCSELIKKALEGLVPIHISIITIFLQINQIPTKFIQ
jgi:hypothetical protein